MLVCEAGAAQQHDPVFSRGLGGAAIIDEKRIKRGDNQMQHVAKKTRVKLVLVTGKEFNMDWIVDEIKELLIILAVLIMLRCYF